MSCVFDDSAVAACDETLTVEPVRCISVSLRQARLTDGIAPLAVRVCGGRLEKFVAGMPREGQGLEIPTHPRPSAVDQVSPLSCGVGYDQT